MVAGHLRIKNNIYYMVLSYTDEQTRKRKEKWISTHLTAKGNKTRAEHMLIETRKAFKPPRSLSGDLNSDMKFSDYMLLWLEIIRPTVEKTTYASYTSMVKNKIVPYFEKKDLTVASITAKDIQMFYAHELKTVSPNTVIHEHANIHRALKYALKMDLIDFNPADKVDRPKKQKFIAEHYSLEELEALFDASKNHYLGLLIQVTAFYGLRRSETLGLRWDAIDFENKTITIKHILTTVQIDGKQTIIKEDRAKTKSSLRSLPLVPRFEKAFRELKEQQEENRRVCGKSYCTEYIDYVFVNGIGKIYNPNNVTEAFGKLLKENGLRKIRFHDLRHSCASLLLANGVSLKEIQEWLGHSDIATTADIYSHLDFKSKISSAYLMDGVLNLPEPIIKEDWGVE